MGATPQNPHLRKACPFCGVPFWKLYDQGYFGGTTLNCLCDVFGTAKVATPLGSRFDVSVFIAEVFHAGHLSAYDRRLLAARGVPLEVDIGAEVDLDKLSQEVLGRDPPTLFCMGPDVSDPAPSIRKMVQTRTPRTPWFLVNQVGG